MPAHRKARQEHDHNLRHKMHQSHPHRRQREQLTRQINLANQSAVNHHGAGTITKTLREEVNGNHAREKIHSIVVHTAFQAKEKTHGNVEHQELHTRLNVGPQNTQHRAAVADLDFLIDQKSKQVAILHRIQDAAAATGRLQGNRLQIAHRVSSESVCSAKVLAHAS